MDFLCLTTSVLGLSYQDCEHLLLLTISNDERKYLVIITLSIYLVFIFSQIATVAFRTSISIGVRG